MAIIHAKSPCCGAKVHRFGKRRRQCPLCRKTWRIRPKRRGRKPVRVHPSIASVAFGGQESLRHRAARLHRGREFVRRRHAKRLAGLLRVLPEPSAPKGKLIALIDGWGVFFNRKRFTHYLLLLRSVKEPYATVMEPFFLPGWESERGWRQAFATLPKEARERIEAVVSDGVTGIEYLVGGLGWILQRCHFHLLSALQALRGQRLRKVRHKKLREEIYQTVQRALKTPSSQEANRCFHRLTHMAKEPQCPKWLRKRLGGFLKQFTAFRAYRLHPSLHLPTTTNTVESVCRLLADTMHRTQRFSNPSAFKQWIKVQIRTMKPIQCNGHNYQPN